MSFAQIDDLDSIGSFEATLSYSREVSAERATNITRTAQALAAPQPPTAVVEKLREPASDGALLEILFEFAGRLAQEQGLEELPKRFTELFEKLAKTLALDEHDKLLSDLSQPETSTRSKRWNRHQTK